MLINFCEKHLQTTVLCSAVSNDGYEVTNLVSDSDKGFLAYSCIKPPIHIDFTFLCDVRVSSVSIWPSVGAQRSSGFELCVKSTKVPWNTEYKKVSTGFLDSAHSGILFYRRDIARETTKFLANPNFLQRYIRVSDSRLVDNVRNLRISILRTENSVPAIRRVEVWGSVSQSCSGETADAVHRLWMSARGVRDLSELQGKSHPRTCENDVDKNGEPAEETWNVPECFLDPITCSIMIQPVVLPSGVTIDQSTLEKHAKAEATWGRSLSDPFTGIPFSESRKPVIASALKARIDKFLLDNKHTSDVKCLPRLSGYKQILTSLRNRSVNLSEITPEVNTVNNTLNLVSTIPNLDEIANRTLLQSAVPATCVLHPKTQNETRAHRLPVIPMCSKRGVTKKKVKMPNVKLAASLSVKNAIDSSIDRVRFPVSSRIENNLDHSVQTLLSSLQRFDKDRPITRICLKDCMCSTRIFYKLPCNHVVCKDILTSTKNNSQCAICGIGYSSRDPERIHTPWKLH